jgi:hypothetical protein
MIEAHLPATAHEGGLDSQPISGGRRSASASSTFS